MMASYPSRCCNRSIPIAASVLSMNSSDGWGNSLSGSESQLLGWGLGISCFLEHIQGFEFITITIGEG